MAKREYRKEYGSFYFYENDRMQYMADEVGIVFAVLDGNAALIKHGPATNVVAWWTKNRQKYEPLFGELAIVESDQWNAADLTDLTECLERPHKIAELLASIGRGIIDLEQPNGG